MKFLRRTLQRLSDQAAKHAEASAGGRSRRRLSGYLIRNGQIRKSLVTTDSRLPLTVALAYAFAAGQVSTELLDTRKGELTDLVSEAAKTFGFQSKTTLTNAFDMATGLLSLAWRTARRAKSCPRNGRNNW